MTTLNYSNYDLYKHIILIIRKQSSRHISLLESCLISFLLHLPLTLSSLQIHSWTHCLANYLLIFFPVWKLTHLVRLFKNHSIRSTRLAKRN